LSTPQSSLHSAFAVLDRGRELRTARAEVETKAPEQTSALARSEREHCDVIDIIPAIVWSALPDGSNVYVNSRFVEYSGMSAKQLAGSGWHAATQPDDLQRYERKWLAFVRAGDHRPSSQGRISPSIGIVRGLLFLACFFSIRIHTTEQ
jgi:PAS domain S-box-containing protein